MISNLEEIYCIIDNLTSLIDKESKKTKIGRRKKLSRSELLTIAIIKQTVGIETNKQLYFLIKKYMKSEFSNLPSYQQFCAGLESNFWHLGIINSAISEFNKQKMNDFFVVDSTAMPLCSLAYRGRSSIGKGIASSGKNMNGWYYGFKLHVIINQNMDIVSFKFTTASIADIVALDEKMVRGITGKLVGDKGYLGIEKKKELRMKNIDLITRARKNMRKLPVEPKTVKVLSRRQIVESTFGMLKDRFCLISKKARSLKSFFAQAMSALLAYNLQDRSNILRLSAIS